CTVTPPPHLYHLYLHDALPISAIDHDLGAAVYGSDDLRQHMHGAAPMIELTAAMVGDVDPIDAVIDRDMGVLRGRDALDDQRQLELVLDQLDGVPAQRLLVVAARSEEH